MATNQITDEERAARSLFRTMTEISEEYYCAQWMGGLGRQLWNLTLSGGGSIANRFLDRRVARGLAHLALTAGVWWIWDDVAVKSGHLGPRRIALEDYEADARGRLRDAIDRMPAEDGMDDPWH